MFICVCKKLNTEAIDRAICAGANSFDEVSLDTGAGTQCGLCEPGIVERVVHIRLRHRVAKERAIPAPCCGMRVAAG